MSLFKNKVGRPSNETLKKRRIVYASVTVVAISLVVVGVFFLYGDFNKKDIVSNEKNIKSNSLKYGDANNDGKVTIDDATAVQNAISGKTKLTDKGMQQADVDGDKKLSQSDVKIIQNYLAGVFKTLPVKVGDVNTDGKVDSTDRDLLDKYIAGWDIELSTAGYILADLNGDGKVKNKDALILDRHIAKWSGYEVLPVLASNVASVNLFQYGDANNDGKVTIDDATAVQNAISGKIKLTDKGMQQADVDGDKKLSQSDVKIIQNYLAGVFKTLPVKVGDVNTDGKVDSTDRDLLDKYIAGDDVKLSTAGYILADLNGDGKVKSRDALILDRHIAKHSGYEVLPVLASNVTSVSVPK